MDCYLVLLETSGNQPYVYGTNKLRENVGASELTRCSTTQWVFEAIRKTNLYQEDPHKQQDALCNPGENPPIEGNGSEVEVIEAVSGKAVLLTRSPDKAKDIVYEVTRKALEEAPGLNIIGAIQKFDWEKEKIWEALRGAYHRYEGLRCRVPGVESLSLRLPVVTDCASSSLPASLLRKVSDKESDSISLSTASKLDAQAIYDRASDVDAPPGWRFARELENEDWVAIVHADGNGLGNVFMHFEEYCGEEGQDIDTISNRQYADSLRAFSCAIDVCTHKAFKTAIGALTKLIESGKESNKEYARYWKTKEVPVRPLVLGGDDLTIFCRADLALPFAEQYLREFETETAEDMIIQPVTARMTFGKFPHPWLSACAGVAIIKQKYPFFAGYQLAEALVESAKDSKKALREKEGHDTPCEWSWPCSAIDFHVLYDSSSVRLADIRERLTLQDGAHLFGAPYVVTDMARYSENGLANTAEFSWIKRHAWPHLVEMAKTLNKKGDDGTRILPNSQIHSLRASLFGGVTSANQALQLILHRYPGKGLDKLAVENSLFVQDPNPRDPEKVLKITYLLDAMEAGKFLSAQPVVQCGERQETAAEEAS